MSDHFTTAVADFTIRYAEPRDVGLILALIRELASYEKLLHEVVADADSLRRHLFGPRPVAEAVIGEYQGQSAGFALFFHSFSTFLGRPGIYLEDLYVKPELRGKGCGRALLAFIAKLAVERDCGRVEWSVLDWNKPSIGFYEGLGAVALDAWTRYRLTGTALARLAANPDPDAGP
ncbi:MAG: GNAT family N-acetyltransferase [Gammaproteobacteria bacterium]